jgi:dolichyl-phosphate-mannose-protein mannosyltransferase
MTFALDTKKALWILLLLAAVTRLTWLSYPNQVIFDEVHFGKFVTAYCCTHERFFDIHPPLTKLLIAGVGKALGYQGNFDFRNIGESYGSVPVWTLRLVPALSGIALPLILFILMRQLGASVAAAFLAGLAATLDNALIVQTRLISLDGMLLVATFGALSAFLAALRAPRGKEVLYLIAAGVAAGWATGTKFTGLSTFLLLGAVTVWKFWKDTDPQRVSAWLARLAIVLCSSLLVYAAGWWLHYSILSLPGSGDAWQVPSGNVLQDTIAMHSIMFNANYNLTATHPYSSPWWSWPVMLRPVFYWQGIGQQAMYFLGNPVVWWGGSLLFLVAFLSTFQTFFEGKRWQALSPAAWLLLFGFLVAYLPFIRIPRALFLYHFLTPLLFALLFGLLWLDDASADHEWALRKQPVWFWGIAAAVAVFCIFFSPLTFGFPVGDTWWHLLFWIPTWR